MTDTAKPKHAGGRPSSYLPEYCDAVEKTMGEGYSLEAFAGEIGVCRATLNVWMNEHAQFLEAVKRAKAKRLKFWEDLGIKTAKDGGGTGSATMIIFGLKNMGGDEWKDRSQVDLNVADGLADQLSRAVSRK